jgi:hypothetical protein
MATAPSMVHPHVLVFQGMPTGQPIRGSKRLTPRFELRMKVRIRLSGMPRKMELAGETRNVSAQGIYFVTDSRLSVGAVVEMPIAMPREITGKPAAEYYYTGKVVRVEAVGSGDQQWGIGVMLYCHSARP